MRRSVYSIHPLDARAGRAPRRERNGSSDPPPDEVKPGQAPRSWPHLTVLTCSNALKRRLCWPAYSVRDEEAPGSNPATPNQIIAGQRSDLRSCLFVQARIVRFWEQGCPILGAILRQGRRGHPRTVRAWARAELITDSQVEAEQSRAERLIHG